MLKPLRGKRQYLYNNIFHNFYAHQQAKNKFTLLTVTAVSASTTTDFSATDVQNQFLSSDFQSARKRRDDPIKGERLPQWHA